MLEDRAALLNSALDEADRLLRQNESNRQTLSLFADVSIECFKATGEYSFVDDALARMREAEKSVGDPDITNLIVRFERRLNLSNTPEPFLAAVDDDID